MSSSPNECERGIAWAAAFVSLLALLQTAVAASAAAQSVSPLPASVYAADTRARIQAFRQFLEGRGITLVEEHDAWWRVERPASDGYVVVVHFRAYPVNVTEKQMREDLVHVNLAFRLNAGARLAMSYPSVRGAMPPGTRLDDLPVRRALLQALDDYRVPGEAR